MAELAKLKTDFVSVVSHELRTPLTSIIGVLQTVTRPELMPQDPDVGALLEAGVSQANRLRTLIEDLLAVSQIDNRAIPVRPEAVDLRELVKSAIVGVPGAPQRARVRIAAEMPEAVIDPEHTRRILINLIANSVKYGDGSPIDVLVYAEEGELVILVADHGPGLPYELSERAFDPFTQLRRTEVRGRGGIGLGLAICKGLVSAMGGTIRYEPTRGGGASFRIRLPFQPSILQEDHSQAGLVTAG
jgi:signal transduction histidine kinase